MSKSKYKELGIDPNKEGVREAFGLNVHNEYPGAFVNILTDPENSEMAITQHMDGDGSKFLARLLMYRELNDESVIDGAVDDALSMNTSDVAAAGFVNGLITVTDVININGFNVPKDLIMNRIAKRMAELIELYRQYGFNIYWLGGETADLPDQVATVVFDIALNARVKKDRLISGNVQIGDKIWGFASDGQAKWEKEWNSGLMSNGLTAARKYLIHPMFNVPHEDLLRDGGSFDGRFREMDPFPQEYNFYELNVFDAMISPTRQWAILIKILIDKLESADLLGKLHGISLNSGGGATKVGHLGKGGILYRKLMPQPPAIFQLIKNSADETWENMFESFNCGVGLDIVCADDPQVDEIIKGVQEETGVNLYFLGRCEPWEDKGKNKVELETSYGSFNKY